MVGNVRLENSFDSSHDRIKLHASPELMTLIITSNDRY